jgi:hypothetical protein
VISVDFMARAVASGSVRQAAERMRGFITSWNTLNGWSGKGKMGLPLRHPPPSSSTIESYT